MAVPLTTRPTDPEIEMALRTLPGWFWHPGHLAQYRCIRAVDGLRTQLQRAQEERDREAAAVDRLENTLIDVNLDKDAAIKRGAAIWNEVVLLDETTINLWRARAKAGERDAAEQRAHPCYCCQDSCWPGCGCHDILERDDSGNTITPAEALRAEHRRPQSGQKEGDGD